MEFIRRNAPLAKKYVITSANSTSTSSRVDGDAIDESITSILERITNIEENCCGGESELSDYYTKEEVNDMICEINKVVAAALVYLNNRITQLHNTNE